MSMKLVARVGAFGSVSFGLLAILSSTTLAQSPDRGSTAPATLTFSDAIERGLRYNLGMIESTLTSADARAARLRALSALLPAVLARAAQVSEDLSLKLHRPHAPRASLDDRRVRLSGFPRQRVAAALQQRAAQSLPIRAGGGTRGDLQRARCTGRRRAGGRHGCNWQIVARAARLETARAELRSAQEFDRQAADRVSRKQVLEIESLRAQVERQGADQRVINARNDLEKDKLALARILGLPIEQPVELSKMSAQYRPLTGITEGSAKDAAFRTRADSASAAASIDASDSTCAPAAQQLRPRPDRRLRRRRQRLAHLNQVYTVAAGVSVPLYTGGRIGADVGRRRTS